LKFEITLKCWKGTEQCCKQKSYSVRQVLSQFVPNVLSCVR